MVICDEARNQRDFFSIYDDELKVLYAMPVDAESWFEKHLNENKSK